MWKQTGLIILNAVITIILFPYYLFMYIIGSKVKMISIGKTFDAKAYGLGYKEMLNNKSELIKDMMGKYIKRRKKK